MPTHFKFPTIGTSAETRATLLAIDDFSLPLRRNVSLYLTKPQIHPQPVLTGSRDKRDAPDFLGTHFYGSVIQEDDGRFRMWYYGVGLGNDEAELTQGPMCYAESEDGITWEKPALGLMEWRDRRDHNAIPLPDWPVEGVMVIKDNGDLDPQRRYKLIYNPKHAHHSWTMRAATSPDGLQWQAGPDTPLDAFIEQSGFYKHDGLYYVNGQIRAVSEGGQDAGRQGWVSISSDFIHWTQELAPSFALPEPILPSERGIRQPYDQVHLGVGPVSFGNVLVGLYGLWHNDPHFAQITCDLGLVVSSDGIHFREPVPQFPYISTEDSPVTPKAGKAYNTILCQSSGGILNLGDETRIYHGRWRNAPYQHGNWRDWGDLAEGQDYWGEVALATLPRDRWAALGLYGDSQEGSIWSAPVTLPMGGCQVALNADAASAMRVEISDANLQLLKSFSGENAGQASTDGLESPVFWSQGDLSTLGGETVRFRIHLNKLGNTDPRLYALYLVA